MKRRSLPLLLASSAICLLTSSLFAGGPGNFDAPAQIKHFNVYGEGMLVYPTENGSYLYTTNKGTTDTSTIVHFPHKSDLGGTIGGSYLFGNQSDIRAEWTDYTGKFKDTSDGSTPPNPFSYKTTYEAVNLDLGQNWHPVSKLNLHFFTGLAYRHLTDDVTGENTSASQYSFVNVIGKTTFSGWGPRFGIDGDYHYLSWLDVIANASMSLPYGGMDINHLSIQRMSGEDPSKVNIHKNDIHLFIPELAGNTGLQFSHNFGNIWTALEVGYRVTHLMNASLDRLSVLSKKTLDPEQVGFHFHDMTYFGPYLRLSVRF